MRQKPVCSSSNEEPTEEIQVVDIGSTLWHRFANGTNEANNVDEDTTDVGCVTAPVEAKRVIVWGVSLGAVEVSDLEVAFPDDVVVADDDTGDGREEDRIGAEVCREIIGCGEEVPKIAY